MKRIPFTVVHALYSLSMYTILLSPPIYKKDIALWHATTNHLCFSTMYMNVFDFFWKPSGSESMASIYQSDLCLSTYYVNARVLSYLASVHVAVGWKR